MAMTAPHERKRMTTTEAYAHAVSLFNAGHAQQALSLAEQLIAAMPGVAQPANLAAMAARELGDLDKAERLLRQVVASHPDYANAYSNLGLVLQDKKDFAAAEQA
jgi:tetratricopeptide (TPR) repeat protein